MNEPVVFVLLDSRGLRNTVCAALAGGGWKLVLLDSAADYLREPDPGGPCCVVLGLELPDMSGPELQGRLGHTGAAIVFVSERVDLPQSVRAIKAGAVDFLTTPIQAEQLTQSVMSAIELDKDRRASLSRFGELQRRYRELTPRECELLPLIADGMLNKQVACLVGISPMTVQIHRGRIMRKMGARSFADLVRMSDVLNSGAGTARERIFGSPQPARILAAIRSAHRA